MNEITVQELKQKIDNGEQPYILDVREPFEQHQSDINYENKTLIPIGKLKERVEEISDKKDAEIVCMCRSGGRSAQATRFLANQGFSNVKNLKGGINKWAKEIDNSLPVY
ncbi:MAG: rhodanese-like domain-containing protein [Balneolaceae bacterium]|nr:rhodanese-like domain-containing protein [Balneolaceae bacterium]